MGWLGVQVQVQALALLKMRVAGSGHYRAQWRRTTVLILACFQQGRLWVKRKQVFPCSGDRLGLSRSSVGSTAICVERQS